MSSRLLGIWLNMACADTVFTVDYFSDLCSILSATSRFPFLMLASNVSIINCRGFVKIHSYSASNKAQHWMRWGGGSQFRHVSRRFWPRLKLWSAMQHLLSYVPGIFLTLRGHNFWWNIDSAIFSLFMQVVEYFTAVSDSIVTRW